MNSSPTPSDVPWHMRYRAGQFIRFAVVGLAGTGLHYLVLFVLVTLAGVTPGPAAFTGAVAGAVVNYWLNRRFTFQSVRRHRETLPLFLAMAAIGALLNGLIVNYLSSLGLHFMLAQVIATGIVLILNFLMSKKWIFL